MPHDRNGKEIRVGDEVLLRAKVTQVWAGEDYCNITIESITGRKPDGLSDTAVLNAAVLEVVSG